MSKRKLIGRISTAINSNGPWKHIWCLKMGHLPGCTLSRGSLGCLDMELTLSPSKLFSGPPAVLPSAEDLGLFQCTSNFEMDGHETFLTTPTLKPIGLSARKKLFPFLYGCCYSAARLCPTLQHARLPRPPLSPRVCTNSCPLSWWCY